jgi:hypothetical protein
MRIEMVSALSSLARKANSKKPSACSMFEYFFTFSSPLSVNEREMKKLTRGEYTAEYWVLVVILVRPAERGLVEEASLGRTQAASWDQISPVSSK